jgi:hypothetical protein
MVPARQHHPGRTGGRMRKMAVALDDPATHECEIERIGITAAPTPSERARDGIDAFRCGERSSAVVATRTPG